MVLMSARSAGMWRSLGLGSVAKLLHHQAYCEQLDTNQLANKNLLG